METSSKRVREMVDRAFVIEEPTEIEGFGKAYPEGLVPFHLRLVESEFRWVADLFRGMTEETAAELVRRLDGSSDSDPASLVHVLAAGATDTAVAAFHRWSETPPPWIDDVGVPLARAAHAGGWEPAPGGARRRLTSAVAVALTPVAADSGEPVSGGTVGECGFCGFPMARLLDVDRAVLPDLFGAESSRLLITTCTLCGSYATILTEDGRFAVENERPDYLPMPEPWSDGAPPDGPPLGLGAVRSSPFAGTAWDAGGSTVGGSPQWIQDPEFPVCPRCSRTMPFVGMLTGDDLWKDLGEGCFYLFHDPGCGLSAAVYQQS